MNTPGFTGEASLYKTSEYHHMAPSADAAAIGQRVLPQLFAIGFCMARCRPGDWLCIFDCLRGGYSTLGIPGSWL